MYKVVYHLTDGSVVSVDLDEYSEENAGELINKTERAISMDKTILVRRLSLLGYPEIVNIRTKYITQVEYINLDDEVTENN